MVGGILQVLLTVHIRREGMLEVTHSMQSGVMYDRGNTAHLVGGALQAHLTVRTVTRRTVHEIP